MLESLYYHYQEYLRIREIRRPFYWSLAKKYHITPYSVCSEGDEGDSDPADTARRGALFSQTPDGVKGVRAAEIRLHFPKIAGISFHFV